MWFPHVFLTRGDCVCVCACDFSAIFQMCNPRPLSSHTGFTGRHVVSKGQHRHGEHLRPRYQSEWAEGKVYTVSPFFKHDPLQWLKKMPEYELSFRGSHKLECKPSLGNVCLHLVRCPTWICHSFPCCEFQLLSVFGLTFFSSCVHGGRDLSYPMKLCSNVWVGWSCVCLLDCLLDGSMGA